MLHPMLQDKIEHLLRTWRAYDDLDRKQAPLQNLVRARAQLDETRDEVYRLRRAPNPKERELVEVGATNYCPSLGTTMFVAYLERWRQAIQRCLCGVGVSLHPARSYTTR
jgi:hypothetical protein